jgi:hypothetical protein
MQNKYNIEPYGTYLVQAEGSLPNGDTYECSAKDEHLEVIVYRKDKLEQIILYDKDASK